MMEKLIAMAAKFAGAQAARLAERLAEAARAELPADVTVEQTGTKDGGVVSMAGRALLERALTEVALRGLAALARSLR